MFVTLELIYARDIRSDTFMVLRQAAVVSGVFYFRG